MAENSVRADTLFKWGVLIRGPQKTAHGFPPRINSAEKAPQNHLHVKKSPKEKGIIIVWQLPPDVNSMVKFTVENALFKL